MGQIKNIKLHIVTDIKNISRCILRQFSLNMEEEGYQSFINVVAKDGSDDIMELPREKDGTVLLSTVQAQFPSAIGLKYKSPSGGWRGIRVENNVLHAPHGGWGDAVYIITESESLKRKANEEGEGRRKSKRSSKLLEDLIVLGIPFSTKEEEINEYFTSKCGDLAFCQLKTNRETNKSRGFAFIRFKSEEAAEEALKGHHEIEGRKLEIKLSKRKDGIPMKLFIGRLANGTTQEDVNDYFSDFGDMSDVFVPSNPFRGFGFVTYSSQEDAMKVLRMNHNLLGANLNVTAHNRKKVQDREDRRTLELLIMELPMVSLHLVVVKIRILDMGTNHKNSNNSSSLKRMWLQNLKIC